MRIALLGANGQLGQDLVRALSGTEVLPFTRRDFDVTDHDRTRSALLEVKPDCIINTTAYHRVDDCETQPRLAYDVNVVAVLNLARISNELDATLVQFSTDYVFDGDRRSPYTEEMPPFPLSVYGNSRLAGEMIVRTTARKYFLIRTCGLYGQAGSSGKGGNFVEAMLRKAARGEPAVVVNDQTVTPTSTLDLARQVSMLLPTTHYGLFHATSEGACSWFEFAQAIFELSGIRADLSPTTSAAYRAPAIRPSYSVLENARLKQLGLNCMLHWREALAEYLREKMSIAG